MDYPYNDTMGAVGPYDRPDRALERYMHSTTPEADPDDETLVNRVNVLLEEANAAGHENDFETALARAREARELLPDNLDAIRYEFLSLLALERWEEAYDLIQEERAELLETMPGPKLDELEERIADALDAVVPEDVQDTARDAAATAKGMPGWLKVGAFVTLAYYVFKR